MPKHHLGALFRDQQNLIVWDDEPKKFASARVTYRELPDGFDLEH